MKYLNTLKKLATSKTILAIVALVAVNETALVDALVSFVNVPGDYLEPVRSIITGVVALIAAYGRIKPKVQF